MLVLTRKQNEQICIGDNIKITVIRTKGKAVRLGIEAPTEISVLRGELVFDDSKTEATPAKAASTRKPLAPVADGSPFAKEEESDRRAQTGYWPESQARSEESSFATATVSAISMRDFLTSRV